MRALKTPIQFITYVGDQLRSKNEQQRRDRAIAAVMVLCVLALLYYYFT